MLERRELGKTGLTVTVLGFGGAELGFDSGVTVDRARELLAPAIDAGLDVIDTASAYLASESLLGEVLARDGLRERVKLFTKCGMTDGFSRGDWSAGGIRAQVERSLRALRTDHVELLQLHSCGVSTLENGESVDVLRALKAEGKTRFIGYSGDGAAARWAVEHGGFDTLQTSLSMADQEAVELTLPLAREKGLGVIAKRPLGNVAWRTGEAPPEDSYNLGYWQRYRELAYPLLARPLPEAAATALRFTLAQPGVSVAIVGSSRPGRWLENAQAAALGPLPDADVQAIRARWKAVARGWSGLQ